MKDRVKRQIDLLQKLKRAINKNEAYADLTVSFISELKKTKTINALSLDVVFIEAIKSGNLMQELSAACTDLINQEIELLRIEELIG